MAAVTVADASYWSKVYHDSSQLPVPRSASSSDESDNHESQNARNGNELQGISLGDVPFWDPSVLGDGPGFPLYSDWYDGVYHRCRSPVLEGRCPACFPSLPASLLMNWSFGSGVLQQGGMENMQDTGPRGPDFDTCGVYPDPNAFVPPHPEEQWQDSLSSGARDQLNKPFFSKVSHLEPVYSFDSEARYKRGRVVFAQTPYIPGEPCYPFWPVYWRFDRGCAGAFPS
uniref:Uncharacterized protein n=1 Tax=Hippocampus comes TaxID=109280 RepID=A0A3Q2YEP0_HIPCM